MDDFLEFEEIRQEYERLKFPWEERRGEERRAFARRANALPVRFMGEELESYLFSIDVGGGGVRLISRKPLEASKQYELELLLKDLKKPVRVLGRLVWSRPLNIPDEFYEVGIMFEDILPEDRKRVAEYAGRGIAIEDDERRKFLRVPRLLLASITPGPGAEGEKSSAGIVIDLSEGGARILTSKMFPPKSKLELKMELEEGAPIEVDGQVMWGNHVEALHKFQHGVEFVHGVRFQEQRERTREIIQEYLKFKSQLIEANLVETLLNVARRKK